MLGNNLIQDARTVERIIKTNPSEMFGANISQAIGLNDNPINPFLLFLKVDEKSAGGIPAYTHKNLEGLVYALEGSFIHEDDLTGSQKVEEGSVVYLNASQGLTRRFQPELEQNHGKSIVLFNYLDKNQRDEANHLKFIAKADIPVIENLNGASVKVLAGKFHQAKAAFETKAELSVLDIFMHEHVQFMNDYPKNHTVMAFILRGSIHMDSKSANESELVVFNKFQTNLVSFNSGPKGARVLLVAAKPMEDNFVKTGVYIGTSEEVTEKFVNDIKDNRESFGAHIKPNIEANLENSAGTNNLDQGATPIM
jgi:redox-sensitive bicupin YhaK (pirin superfamily)